MSSRRESLLLCEGYDDRAFWQGWLEHRLKLKPRKRLGDKGKWGTARGCYTYETGGGHLVHVIPCMGEGELWRFAAEALREIEAPSRIVLNMDVDDDRRDLRAAVRSLLARHDACDTPEGDFSIKDGAIVSLIPWHVPESGAPDLAGVPAKQALERIVCTAICRARPEWGIGVQSWLMSRRDPRGPEHKAHAWSFAAGWFADHGPGDFYSAVWRDPDIAPELERQMTDIGARRVVEALTDREPTRG